MRQIIRAGTTEANSDTGQQFANKINSMTEELYAGMQQSLDTANTSVRNWLMSRPPIPNCNNTALEPGYHRTDTNTLNAPEGSEGALFMLRISENHIKQIWYGLSNARYEREHINNTWSAWMLGDLRIGEVKTVTFDNVPMSQLQDVINSLPKQLNQNYVINALPGVVNSTLSVRKFSGPGILHIRGAVSRDTFTHRAAGIIVRNTSCSRIIIEGFTADTADTSFEAMHCTSEIMFIMCNSTVTSSTGVVTNWCPMVGVWLCTLSNKDAAVWGSVGLINVHDLSGVGNGILYAAANAGIIRIVTPCTIQPTPTVNFAHCTNGGIVYDHLGRPFHGISGIGGTGLTAAETFTVNIANLRNFLRSRSRYLSGNLTINVNGGTTADLIELAGFYGPGTLTVNGAANANLQTHVVQGFSVINCYVGYQINGFTAATTSLAAFNVIRSPMWSEINNCHIRAGTGTASGIVVGHGSNIQIANTVINGRHLAIHCHHNSAVDVVGSVTGTGNVVALYVTSGSVVRSRAALGMDGGVFFSNGGYVVVGSDNLSPIDGLLDLGSAGQRWRTLFTTNGTVNSSDEREKTDVASLPDNLPDFFMRLNPVSYKRIDDESEETHWGLIAQEVEKAVQESAASNGIQALDRSGGSPFTNFAGVVKSPIIEMVDTGEGKETRVPVKRYETKVREVPVTRMVSMDEYEELLRNKSVKFSTLPDVASDMASSELFEITYTEIKEYIEEADSFEIETEPIMEERIVGERYGIRYSEFVPMLIKMVQMQQREIEAIKNVLGK